MIKDQIKKKNVNASSDRNSTNQKKGSAPQDEGKTKKKKPMRLRNGNGRIKKSL